ncbi:MAG: patatin-like phospholipase family protein [Sphingobium sp.]|nr:patatin-like phospholipase family protein [Sphingobium sp.]MCP5398818.1 patatin-like phospholipase family protein [Sphingomonas sp.]
MRKFLLILLPLMLSACATRGSLQVECRGFTEADQGRPAFRRPLPLTDLEKQIRESSADLPLGPGQTESGLMTRAYEAYSKALIREKLHVDDPLMDETRPERPAILLLSGGGQWGAFGAGFLSGLAEKGQLPNFFIVTGVSTGSMQAMFVGTEDEDRWDWLTDAYTIEKESELVDRNPQMMAIITGSFAGLKPLQQKIKETLCPPERAGEEIPCPGIEALRNSERQILVGFVEANSGEFYYTDMKEIAQGTDTDNALACITGATLASSAMPVTFQQVRIGKRAYYDGGVRQSVFATTVEMVARLVSANFPGQSKDVDVPLYVVRNGPTNLIDGEGNDKADKSPTAFTAAARAQQIVTNQLEVGSIAALRLQKPKGDINFVSAKGWEDFDIKPTIGKYKDQKVSCRTIRNAMDGRLFDPAFMECMRAFGRAKALSDNPWIKLKDQQLDKEGQPQDFSPASLPMPANDN